MMTELAQWKLSTLEHQKFGVMAMEMVPGEKIM